MGIMEDTGTPVNTFAARAYDDCNLLSFAYVYEQASRRRVPPRLTPSLGFGRPCLESEDRIKNRERQIKWRHIGLVRTTWNAGIRSQT
jgi:hypothetical protein